MKYIEFKIFLEKINGSTKNVWSVKWKWCLQHYKDYDSYNVSVLCYILIVWDLRVIILTGKFI